MTWFAIRLDLAHSEGFPKGSPTHRYFLRALLTDQGTIDARAIHDRPEQATIIRSWPGQPDQHGYLVHRPTGWYFSDAPGGTDDEPIFHLETHPLDLGAQLTVHERDGEELRFRIARRDEIQVAA